MKNLKTLLVSLLIISLIFLPAQRASSVNLGPAARRAVGAAAGALPGLVPYIPTAVAFAAAHPIIITAGGVLVASSIAYTGYKTYQTTKDAVWTVAPYFFIPFANNMLANKAVAEDNPGLLDYSLSTGRLIKMFQRVPYIGQYVANPVKLNDGQLHGAIRDGRKVADVMIDRHAEAGIDLNKEHAGRRPLGVALEPGRNQLELGRRDELAEKLIRQPDVHLAGHDRPEQNLFHDVLASDKTELIRAAVARGDAVPLMDTVDAHGNPVPTLAAVSPGLRVIVDGSGHAPPPTAFARANEAGLTPADAILHAHRAGDATPAEVVRYLDAPAGLVIQDPTLAFRATLADPALSAAHVPERLVERGAVPADRPDAAGQTPIQLAIARDDDGLASRLVPRTSPEVLRAQHSYGRALLHRLGDTARAIRERIGFGSRPDDQLDFYSNPLGEGRSILAHLIEGGGERFDAVVFRDAYRLLVTRLGGNPLEAQTLLQANLLQSAASMGNRPAVETIMQIMQEEGFSRHLAVLAGGGHETVPLLISEGYGPELAAAAAASAARIGDADDLGGDGATLGTVRGLIRGAREARHITTTQLTELPPLLEAGLDPSRAPRALQDRPADGGGAVVPSGRATAPGDGILVLAADGTVILPTGGGRGAAIALRPGFAEDHAALREERLAIPAREREQQAVREHVQEEDAIRQRDERAQRLPPKRAMRPAHRAERITVPELKKSALLGGYFASNFIDQRSGLGHVLLIIPGVDKVIDKETVHSVTNNYEMAWGAAYFAASLTMSYGGNTGDLFSSTNLRNAGLNTAAYSAKRYFHGSPKTDELPPVDKRGTWDFLKRYGPSVTANMGWTLLRTGLMVYITGATMGTAGVVIPVAMTLGTDLLTYYDAYYTKDQSAESQGWDSYLAPYVIASMGTMYYVSQIASLATTGVSDVNRNMQLVQNLFGGLITFGTTHQLSSLFYDNFGKPVVDKTGSSFSWAYRKVFGSGKTQEVKQQPNQTGPSAPVQDQFQQEDNNSTKSHDSNNHENHEQEDQPKTDENKHNLENNREEEDPNAYEL